MSVELKIILHTLYHQRVEVHCHDLEVMSSNPIWVELGVRCTSF